MCSLVRSMPPRKKTPEAPPREEKTPLPSVSDLKELSQKSGASVTNPSLSEIKQLLETSIKWNEVVYDSVEKLNRHFKWMHIAGWFKLLIVVLPLILGTVYLIPYIEPTMQLYKDLLSNISPLLRTGTAGSIQEIPGVSSLSPESLRQVLEEMQKNKRP